jgi:hypothetical protein
MDGTTKRRLLEKRRQKWQIFGWICSHRRKKHPVTVFPNKFKEKEAQPEFIIYETF